MLTFEDACVALTGPGAPLELAEAEIRGRSYPIFTNASANLAEAFAGAATRSDEEFLVYEQERWTYGDVDMTCGNARYRQLAEDCGMRLVDEEDITEQTLPTYEFLKQGVQQWQNGEHAELFLKATGWLEKASRKKMIQYMIITFVK